MAPRRKRRNPQGGAGGLQGVEGLRLTLQGGNNSTLEGTIRLDDPSILRHLLQGVRPPAGAPLTTTTTPSSDEYDAQGASAYAIAVIFVYGFSIVLLIASHIFLKKKEDKKDGENEKEINRYLERAPDLQRFSEKESFRKLKRSIIPLVSVSMLATGIANIHNTSAGGPGPGGPRGAGPGGTRAGAGAKALRNDGSWPAPGAATSAKRLSTEEEEDDQGAPLLPSSPVLSARSRQLEDDSFPQLHVMPTIPEGAESDSVRSGSAQDGSPDQQLPVTPLSPGRGSFTPAPSTLTLSTCTPSRGSFTPGPSTPTSGFFTPGPSTPTPNSGFFTPGPYTPTLSTCTPTAGSRTPGPYTSPRSSSPRSNQFRPPTVRVVEPSGQMPRGRPLYSYPLSRKEQHAVRPDHVVGPGHVVRPGHVMGPGGCRQCECEETLHVTVL